MKTAIVGPVGSDGFKAKIHARAGAAQVAMSAQS